MALDNRKQSILNHIKEYYNDKTFCADDISKTFGEKIYGATLSAIAKAGFLKKVNDKSPVKYVFITDDNNEAINNMAGIFSDISVIKEWPLWENFNMKNWFTHIGKMYPNREKEEILWVTDTDQSDIEEGLVYFFVIDGHIYKCGKTDSLMRERIQSYNCGKQSNRSSGTCSVTNFKVLQTLLNFNCEVDVYAYIAPYIEVNCYGKTFMTKNSPAKAIEKETNQLLIEQFGELPPGCFQS